MNKENQANDQQQKVAGLVAGALADPDFKKRLMAEPRQVFNEEGIFIPKEANLQVFENSNDQVYWVLPSTVDQIVDQDPAVVSLVEHALRDPAFKQRLKEHAHEVLSEHGISLPKEVTLKILEASNDQVYLVLPSLESVQEVVGGVAPNRTRRVNPNNSTMINGQIMHGTLGGGLVSAITR